MTDRKSVFVIDSDCEIRQRLQALLIMSDFDVKTFASADEFLADGSVKQGCLIIDVKSGVNWLELEMDLAKHGHDLIVLVISSHADIPMVIAAMSMGAIDFIEKPFDGEQVVASVRRALDIRAKTHNRSAEIEAANLKIATLTPRERHVAEKLAAGKSNKIVAHELGISPRTVEIHRGSIIKRLKLSSFAELVRLMHIVQTETARDRTEWPRLVKQA